MKLFLNGNPYEFALETETIEEFALFEGDCIDAQMGIKITNFDHKIAVKRIRSESPLPERDIDRLYGRLQ